MPSPRPRQNSEAELQAYDTTCARLCGFDDAISFERVDGFLAALAAGPHVPEAEQWLPALCGDAYDRAFADPEDRAQALRSLQVRLKVLCDQLDAGALIDDPEALRLEPLIGAWTEADRERLAREEGVDAAIADLTGAEWAEGFLDAVEAFPALWVEPPDEESAATFGALIDQIAALGVLPAAQEYESHLQTYYPKGAPTREELVAEACWAVQELRLYWVDHAPKPPTRRVEPTPGRNEPCPCGSGRKYKKCHGAEAAN
jgi:uncharacterized protein